MLEIYDKLKNEVVGREAETKSILVAMEVGKHILLEGPPGTSKSTLLRNIARESQIPLYIIEGNVDLTPAKLVGHFNPAKVMSDSYQPEYFEKGPLTMAMEGGGIFYIEEFNRMPADVSNVLISRHQICKYSLCYHNICDPVQIELFHHVNITTFSNEVRRCFLLSI